MHYKNYLVIEEKKKKQILKEISKLERSIDERWRSLELSCEIDAFLSKWKSTLDSLAKTLIPLYGFNSKTYRDNGNKLIKLLQNLPMSTIDKTKPLINLIDNNIDTIGKIIELRNKVVHFDKECLTPFHYHLPDKKLYAPNLIWEGEHYDPKDFMIQSVELLRDYIRDFIVNSINGYVENMFLVVDTKGHQWLPKNNNSREVED